MEGQLHFITMEIKTKLWVYKDFCVQIMVVQTNINAYMYFLFSNDGSEGLWLYNSVFYCPQQDKEQVIIRKNKITVCSPE